MALGGVLVLSTLASACRGGPSPDSRPGLAFTRTDGHHYAVWVAEADGSDAQEIATHAFAGTLSPDGRRLAYSLPEDEPGSGVPKHGY